MSIQIERKEIIRIKIDELFINAAIKGLIKELNGIDIHPDCPISFMSGNLKVEVNGAFIEFTRDNKPS